MRRFHQRTTKGLALVAAGAYLLQAGCLPKDYWADFGNNGRAFVLDAFAETIFTAITDTLFPGLDDDDDTTT